MQIGWLSILGYLLIFLGAALAEELGWMGYAFPPGAVLGSVGRCSPLQAAHTHDPGITLDADDTVTGLVLIGWITAR